MAKGCGRYECADPARHGGDVVEVRRVAHGGHRGVEIAREFRANVLLEYRHHLLLSFR